METQFNITIASLHTSQQNPGSKQEERRGTKCRYTHFQKCIVTGGCNQIKTSKALDNYREAERGENLPQICKLTAFCGRKKPPRRKSESLISYTPSKTTSRHQMELEKADGDGLERSVPGWK